MRFSGSVSLPDYLWGIETLHAHAPFVNFGASRLPMRNWNQKPGFRLANSAASRLPMRNWNPRGEAEYSVRRRLPDYLWGIETVHSDILPVLELASRLPMRNWNLCIAWWHDILLSLPDYLWGIETYRPLWPCSQNLASRLPMRNWNYVQFLVYKKTGGFQTTYEELKLLEQLLRERFFVLPDYLWGIETLLRGLKMN